MIYGTLVQVANRIKRHNRYFDFEKAENCLEILGNMNQYIMDNNTCVGMTFTGIDYIEDENELIIVWKDCTINKLENGGWEYLETNPRIKFRISKNNI